MKVLGSAKYNMFNISEELAEVCWMLKSEMWRPIFNTAKGIGGGKRKKELEKPIIILIYNPSQNVNGIVSDEVKQN